MSTVWPSPCGTVVANGWDSQDGQEGRKVRSEGSTMRATMRKEEKEGLWLGKGEEDGKGAKRARGEEVAEIEVELRVKEARAKDER
jgi:hypothetical protein